MHLNFALTWWDSFICDCICQKNIIKKLAWDHVFAFKTLSFYCAFVRTFCALFAFFAFCASFAFCQSRLRHRAFFAFHASAIFAFHACAIFAFHARAIFAFHAQAIFALSTLYRFVGEGETISPLSKPFTSWVFHLNAGHLSKCILTSSFLKYLDLLENNI